MNRRTLIMALPLMVNAAVAILLGAPAWIVAAGVAAGWVALVLLIESTRETKLTPKGATMAGLIAVIALAWAAVWPWAAVLCGLGR